MRKYLYKTFEKKDQNKLQAFVPDYPAGNWRGLKWPLVLKKLAQVLDKLISSRHAKFGCPKLSGFREDSGTNKHIPYRVLYNTRLHWKMILTISNENRDVTAGGSCT